MDSQPGPSNAVVRKRSNMDLMPPPPPAKKIKRPKKVLDEDSYTDTLSQIIARDFFPGLLETEIQQEYLDAVESKDAAWISSASRRLKHVMTPGRRQLPTRSRDFLRGGQTPTSYTGDTPATAMSIALEQPTRKLDPSMTLSKFQATYTSEDNESFYKLVDKQNQKKADKYAWLWRGNKLPSKQMIKQKEIEDQVRGVRGNVEDDGFRKDRLAIKDKDDRPARPDAWDANPKNGLMFEPDGVEDGVVTVAQKAESQSRMAPKSIVYENTRMPQPHAPQRPPSPTLSAVRDAISGKPRQNDQSSSVAGGGETPRVNGYPFVDEEDDDYDVSPESIASFNLGSGDPTNPFKLQEQRKRESLHERMVDRIARSNKEASRKGFTGKNDRTEVPKFPSSPRVSGTLTPAAQRLWSKIGSPRRQATDTPFGSSTPKKPRGSLLKSVSRPTPKPG